MHYCRILSEIKTVEVRAQKGHRSLSIFDDGGWVPDSPIRDIVMLCWLMAPGAFRGKESNSERIFWIGPTPLLLQGERHFHVFTVTKHLTISCKNWEKAFPKNEF